MSGSLAIAERNVPRYTSYPTAPHFSPAIGPSSYGEWLAAMPAGAALSLYVHVPFCVELCLYCGCTTKAVRQREPVKAYTERLLDEIALLRPLAPHKVTQIHWGGGTPSILGDELLAAVVDKLGATLDLSALREHAIELDPRRIGPQLVQVLATLGVSRASLGVQDFSPHVQEAIGRVQPFEAVARAVDMLREAGIEEINFDLMYGLPRQSADDVARTAELATSLKPQRLALFGYAHVPWFRPHQRLIDDAALPGLAERLAQARTAASTLGAHGYVAIGLDHFALADDELTLAARGGRLHRNFQGYTPDSADALIGIGASAIGRLPQGFVQNSPDVAGYSRAVASGRFATARGLALSDDDRRRGQIIERLMCDLAVDLNVEPGGREAYAAEVESLAPLAREGLLRIEQGRLTISEEGRPYARLVAAAFDAYLAAGQKRHSVAV